MTSPSNTEHEHEYRRNSVAGEKNHRWVCVVCGDILPIKRRPARRTTPELREDILFALTGDSYGEELHVNNKAKSIADGMVELIQAREQQLLTELLGELPGKQEVDYRGLGGSYFQGFNNAIDQVVEAIEKYRERL